MTEHTNISDSYHPTAILLPFYLNGTLSDQERHEVETHLVDCQDCQQELEMMQGLHTEVKAYYTQLPQPSPNVFSRVRAQIEQEAAVERGASIRVKEDSTLTLGAHLQELLQSVFSTQWAPALAMSIIVGQTGLLMWTMSSGPIGTYGPAVGPVIERSVPPATLQMVHSNIEIAFREQASEKEIREIIRNHNARIVDGPTMDGRYTIEVSESDPARLKEIIEKLSRQKTVRLAKQVTQPNP